MASERTKRLRSKSSPLLRSRGAVTGGIRGALGAAPRWFLAGTLLVLPWILGGTTPMAARVLVWTAAPAGSLTLVVWLTQKHGIRGDWLNTICAGILLTQGWLMTGNPRYVHHLDVWQFTPLEQPWQAGPGSVDQATSATAMWRTTALLIWLLLATDFARDSRWRGRLRWSLVLAATSIALFGLVQRSLRASSIFWQGEPTTSPFFATFYYAPNAGAFINLAFPLALGLAMTARRGGESSGCWRRPVSVLAATICFAGCCVNASRAALIILLLSTFALTVWYALRRHHPVPTSWRRSETLAVSAGALAFLVIIISVGIEVVRQKWSLLPEQLDANNPRLLAMSAQARMIPDAGACGFGPGTFAIVFPHYTHFLGDRIAGIWRYAHNDYLQTRLEWGWFGAGVWGVLFFGGLRRCFAAARNPIIEEREQTLAFAAGVALTGVALHALIDFPLQIASLQLDVVTLLAMAASTHQPVKAGR